MSIQKYIVSNDESIYEAWPDLTLTKTGTLICVFTECISHSNRDSSRIMLTESYDRGRTWTKKHPLTDKTSKDDYFNCARINKLPDGTLVIICDRCYGGEKPGVKLDLYIWFSYDDGKTWTEPILGSNLGLKGTGIVPDKYRVLKSGRHIISTHTFGEGNKLVQSLWYSDDNGKTWSDKIKVASDINYNLCEGCILECDNNTLICYLRENSGKGYDCMKTISYDNGETWSDVYPVPIPGCHRPVVDYLKSGKLMMTYRFMQGGKGWLGSWTQNIFACILNPEQILKTGRNEQSVRIMPIDYDRSPYSDLGYTGWVQFDDGEIYIVNYIVDDAQKAQIRGYSLYENEFIIE